MSKLYCQKCYKATDYTESKPCFCASCGNQFSSAQASQVIASHTRQVEVEFQRPPPPKRQTPKPVYQEVEDEIENEDRQNVPITHIELEIEPLGALRPTVNLKNLAFDKGERQEILREKPKKVPFKKFAEQWKNEVLKDSRKEKGLGE